MRIDWGALLLVSVVAVITTVAFVTLLALGIRYVGLATVRHNQHQPASLVRGTGYAFLGLAGLLVLFGIYLIVPIFD